MSFDICVSQNHATKTDTNYVLDGFVKHKKSVMKK